MTIEYRLLDALIQERRIRLLGQEPDVHWESLRDLRRACYAETDAAIAAARGMEARSGETEGLDPAGATARSATPTRPETSAAPPVEVQADLPTTGATHG